MSLAAELKYTFNRAQQDQPRLSERPVLAVSLKTLEQVLEPVDDVLQQDPSYQAHDIGIDYKLKFLRQTCLDLQLAKFENDPEARSQQSSLLNVLQNVIEDVEQAKGGFVALDFEDLLKLSKLSDVLRNDADICKNEMQRELGNLTSSDLHSMLIKTADRIDAAQSRKWTPKITSPSIDLGAVAMSDGYNHQILVQG